MSNPKHYSSRELMYPHPPQPLYTDDDHVLRYKPNRAIEHLFTLSGLDLKTLIEKGFRVDDIQQLAELIGSPLEDVAGLPLVIKSIREQAPALQDQKSNEREVPAFIDTPNGGGKIGTVSR